MSGKTVLKSWVLPIVVSALFAAGQTAAEGFLSKYGDKIGSESSVNLPEMYG